MDRARRTVATALAAVLAVAGCSRTRGQVLAPRPPAAPATASTSISSTTAPTSTTPARPPGLGSGDSGPPVLAMEQRLAALHYDVGTPDGHFGPADTYAVVAFQKVSGMPRTGWATPEVLSALAAATDPAPLVPGGGAMRVEIDIARQVLLLYQGGALTRILPVSTGSGQRYCVAGQCDVAVTPRGSYRIFRRKLGMDVSKLGVLYNPLYFNGGIAIHGEPDDPAYPASHGCVRIPMNASLWFYDTVPNGTPVYVTGGSPAPPALSRPAAPPTTASAPPAPSSVSTTTRLRTTVPPTTVPPTTVPPTTVPPTTVSPTTVAR